MNQYMLYFCASVGLMCLIFDVCPANPPQSAAPHGVLTVERDETLPNVLKTMVERNVCIFQSLGLIYICNVPCIGIH